MSGVTDILEPYSEDIADGKLVIVVDDYKEYDYK
jgi:hypothetical protein